MSPTGISLGWWRDVHVDHSVAQLGNHQWPGRGLHHGRYSVSQSRWQLRQRVQPAESQEFRLAGDSEKLSWLVGVFYADEDLDSRDQLIVGNDFQRYFVGLTAAPAAPSRSLACRWNAIPAAARRTMCMQQESKNWALFTNNSIRFTDALELTLGLRYTDESKDLDSRTQNDHGGAGCAALRKHLRAASTARLGGTPALQRRPDALRHRLQRHLRRSGLFNNVATSQSLDEEEWSGTAKTRLSLHRRRDVVPVVCEGLQGRRLQPVSRAQRHVLPAGRRGDLANGAVLAGPSVDPDTSFGNETVDSYELGVKTRVGRQQPAGERRRVLSGLQRLPAQYLHRPAVRRDLAAAGGVSGRGCRLRVVHAARATELQGGVTYAETTIEDFGGPANLAFFRPERKDDTLSFAPEVLGEPVGDLRAAGRQQPALPRQHRRALHVRSTTPAPTWIRARSRMR